MAIVAVDYNFRHHLPVGSIIPDNASPDSNLHQCQGINAFNENDANTTSKTRDAADLNAKIDQLSGKIKVLGEEIDSLKKEVADMEVEMKRAGEDREKENAEFQQTVSDQRATQKLLNGVRGMIFRGRKQGRKQGITFYYPVVLSSV
jgi:outer membrane murein-binding lipoprotein Lpp